MGQPLPISVSIGVDPAIEIGSCFEPPTTPMGYDELAVAGALRGEPVELAQCLTVEQKAVANAEYVIEGRCSAGRSGAGGSEPAIPGMRCRNFRDIPVLPAVSAG